MKILLYVLLSASTVLQVGALQFDRDGQPVPRVDSDIISGYPSQPGCYFRQPSKCPARPMKTGMWRHDTWAEEHGLSDAGCRDRKGFWDRHCEAEDTKVLYIAGRASDELGPRDPEPGPREPSPRTDSDIVSGTPSQAGCYFRQPSKCPASPMKTALWRHDTWAEQHGVNETGCRDRKGFWDRHCKSDDTKVMYIKGLATMAVSPVRVEERHDVGAADQQREADRRATVIKALTDAQEAREKAKAAAAEREAAEQANIDAVEEKAADEAMAAQEVFPEDARAAKEEAAKRDMAEEALKAELESAKDEHTPSDVALEVAEASWAWRSSTETAQKANIDATEEAQRAAEEEQAAQEAAKEAEEAAKMAEEAQIKEAAKMAEAEGKAQMPDEAARSEQAERGSSRDEHTESDAALDAAETSWEDSGRARGTAVKDAPEAGPEGAAVEQYAAGDEAPADTEEPIPGVDFRMRMSARSLGNSSGGAAEGSAEAAEQLAQVTTLAEDGGAPPAEPGCYMKMPTGCQARRQTKAQRWLRDKWAGGGVLDSTTCMGRRGVWNDYCKRRDVEVVFVGGQIGSEASSERILENPPSSQLGEVMLQLGAESAWPWSRKREKKAELLDANATAKADADSELGNPSEPGCYMRAPSGCPKNPMKTDLWRHDAWAEHHGLDEEGCKGRKQVWDKYCETSDSKVVFVGNETLVEAARAVQLRELSSWPWFSKRTKVQQAEATAKAEVEAEAKVETAAKANVDADSELGNPSEPGCYMRAPSGCPKNPMKTDLWRHDAWAEHHGLDEEGCKGRKQVWDKYCETSDSQIAFVGNATI